MLRKDYSANYILNTTLQRRVKKKKNTGRHWLAGVITQRSHQEGVNTI